MKRTLLPMLVIVVIGSLLLTACAAPTTTPPVETPPTQQMTYTLSVSVSPSGAGSVSPLDDQYEEGSQVTLTATPASGHTFDYWGGDASGSSATVTIIMDSDKSIVAHFTTSEPAKPVIEISGIISSDTTWTADYAYVLVANAGIPDGVTLTIKPGVKISFNRNYRLQVEGMLISRGTSERPIVFSAQESTGDSYAASGVEFTGNNQSDSKIEFCEFHNCWVFADEASPLIQHNFFYDGTIKAEGGTPIVQHNVVEGGFITFMHPYGGDVKIMHNQIAGRSSGILIWCFGESSVTISHNIIEGATTGLQVNTRGGENIEIAYNTFRGNNHAILLQPGRALPMPVDIRITSNNFVASTYKHLTTHQYIETDIIATANWWGTTDETEIQGLIYDYYDDLNLPKVIWEPFLTSPVED